MSDVLENQSSFVFADHLVLDESPTRDFYKSLLQGLIHKNNNMLGVVQGFSSLILMEESISQSTRENVEQMKDSAQNASDLAKIILSASGCAQVTVEAVKLSELLPYLEQNARKICEDNGVTLQMNVSEPVPAVMADSTRLIDVLNELLKNAAEAAGTVEGGQVALDILRPGEATPESDNRVDFFIRNTGKGIAPEKIMKSFLPFHSDKNSSHYGIGLTMSGVLAGQMKMRLGLQSQDGMTTAWLSAKAA